MVDVGDHRREQGDQDARRTAGRLLVERRAALLLLAEPLIAEETIDSDRLLTAGDDAR